jgi:hypothetical protein
VKNTHFFVLWAQAYPTRPVRRICPWSRDRHRHAYHRVSGYRSGSVSNSSSRTGRAPAAIGAPKSTPAEIIDRLNREINAALADPKIKARFAELGGEVLALSSSEYTTRIAEETEKWAKVVKFSGARSD